MQKSTNFQSAKRSFTQVISSFHFVANHKLWHYFIYPFLIDILLASSVFALFYQYTEQIKVYVCQLIGIDKIASSAHLEFFELIKLASQYLVQFLIGLLAFMIYRSLRKNLIVLFCSPIMALLSERVEEIITKKTKPFNGPQFVRDLVRSALLSLRNLAIELTITATIFIISFLTSLFGGPLALLAVPALGILGFLVSSYYFGGSLIDYSLERRQLSIKETIDYNRANKGCIIGIGIAFHLLLMLPVVGVTLAIVLGTTGATRSYLAQQSPYQ